MSFDFGLIKRHPYIAAAVGVFLIILFFMISGWGSKGSTTVVSTGISPDQTAANMQLQMAQMGYQARANDNSMALEAAKYQTDAAIDIATITAALEGVKVAASKDVALAGISSTNYATDAQLQAILAQTAATVEGYRLDASITSQNIAAQAELQRQQNRNNYQIAELNYNNQQTAMRLAGDYAQESLHIAANLQQENSAYAARQNNALLSLLAKEMAA